MNIISASKNDKGINLGTIPKMFKKEYLKYVMSGYPFSTIKSKKLTARTVQSYNCKRKQYSH